MRLRVVAVVSLLLAAAAPSAAAPVGSVPIRSFLHGKVESMKGRRIVIRYDFSSPLQLLDFEPTNPFLVPPSGAWRLDKGKLAIEGSGAFAWKPVLDPDVKANFRAAPREGRDAGIVLVEPDVTSRSIVFAIADTFFSKKDRQRTLAHMITCLGVPESGAARENVFRYVDREWSPAVAAGAEVDVEIHKRLGRNRMVIGDKTLEGGDIGISLPRLRLALYVLETGATWSSLRVEAVLDEAWLRANDIVYDPAQDSGLADEDVPEPEPEAAAAPGSDEIAMVRKWLETVGDVNASAKDREAAAQKVIDRKRISDVPLVLYAGLLYSGDETARTLGSKILKAISGKTLGYHPTRLNAEQRKEAIQRWWAWIRANRTKIDRDEQGGKR